MAKPISILINETKQNLIKVCNESELHPSVLQMIVRELHEEVNKVNTECIRKEQEEYIKALSEERGDEEE